MKVALCIPILDCPKAQFTISALAMQAHTFKSRPDIEFQGHMAHRCSPIEKAREQLAEAAMRGGANWLLWLDDDHVFPPDALLRLLADDLPFVGINARRRDNGLSSAQKLVDGKWAKVEPKREGLEPVELLGFGVTLTSAEMFKAMPRPWFADGPRREDGYFCEQAIKYGFQPCVDHALSAEVGHIAETVLLFDR